MKATKICSITFILFILFECSKPQDIEPKINNGSPVITGLSQTSGKVGDSFQIQGMNFDTTPSGNEVNIGLNILNVISATENLITVQIPMINP